MIWQAAIRALTAASEALALVTDLQTSLFQFQAVAFRLQEENRDLREEIREEKIRLAEREKYQGQKVGPSLLLVRQDQPGIFYCHTCFQTKGAAISLQPRYASFGPGSIAGYRCNVCETVFTV
jgi:hypothetical protein